MDPSDRDDSPLDMFPTYNPPTVDTEEIVEKLAFEFTMQDVCQELEDLKNQMASSSSNGKRRKCANRSKKPRRPQSPNSDDRSNSKYEYTLPSPSGSFDPWTFFNREISFILFNRSMRGTSDEGVIELACAEIGTRIAYHKQKSQENGDRRHIFYKNKLNDFKNEVDRSKAVVLLYVLQKLKPEDIEALERRLFPLPAKLLYSFS